MIGAVPELPETRYARSGDVNIAYQVTGDGPFDLVFVPGFVTHVELAWGLPSFAPFLDRLASFCRLIRFDKRGTGMSDPVSGAPTLETRMDDVRAVMDAVGSQRAAFYGLSEGAAMSILFAATYPERMGRSCSVAPFLARSGFPTTPGGVRSWNTSAMSSGRCACTGPARTGGTPCGRSGYSRTTRSRRSSTISGTAPAQGRSRPSTA